MSMTTDDEHDDNEYAAASTSERTPLLSVASVPPSTAAVRLHSSSSSASHLADRVVHATGQARSEAAVARRDARRRRARSSHRTTSDSSWLPKRRPLIGSSFMPIATQTSVDYASSISLSSIGRGRLASYGSLSRLAQSTSAAGTTAATPRMRRHGSSTGITCERRQQRAPSTRQDEAEEQEDEDEEEDDEEEEGEEETFLNSGLTSREVATICTLAIANLCSTIAFSCIAPFYPQEATLKGMTQSQTGIVFGAFELVMCFAAPFFGKHLQMIQIGSRRMFVSGIFITGITAIAFGFLNLLPSGTHFFWASLAVRVAEAIGDAAFVTSSFAISAKCFPHRIGVVVGILETFAGLGYTAGPALGGALYEAGGFMLPFLVTGLVLLVVGVASYFLVPTFKDEPASGQSKGMLELARIPVVTTMVFAVVLCAISLSFIDPTLAAHLDSFHLSVSFVGLLFLLCGGVYTLAAPLFGAIIDRWRASSAPVMLFGSTATAIAMLLIGPSPLLPFIDKTIPVIIVSLVVLGVAAGALYIPTFQNCLEAAKENGYEDSFETYGCVSGLFQSAFALGAFLGPTLGSVVVERIGFSWTTTSIGLMHTAFTLILLLLLAVRSRCGSRRLADLSRKSRVGGDGGADVSAVPNDDAATTTASTPLTA